MRNSIITGELVASDRAKPLSTMLTMVVRLGRGSSIHICDFMAKAWLRSRAMLAPSP